MTRSDPRPRPDPSGIDFGTLETLCLLHRTGSFTRTAELLEVNQSAVSYTVDKLRRLFDDPLFVREARRQVPTERCSAIVAEAARMVQDFRRLAAPDSFDPATTHARFVIACNYYERLLIIPPLVHALRQQAPGLQLEIVNSGDEGHDRLLAAEADLLIGPFRRLESGFMSRKLTEERYACLMDPSHPAAGSAPELAAYLEFEHVLITYGGLWKSRYVSELEEMGHAFVPAIRVPSPAGVPELIAGTALVATVPHLLAAHLKGPMRLLPCPVPAPFDVLMVWTRRTHDQPMHRWMRDLIARSAKPHLSAQAAPGSCPDRRTGYPGI
ncbi:LysR family transcriptional regulator [Mangrovicoccus algicola]|uniref:LysR family transcriptional regulator n=1 Tax=Mangrovicoccus algicola TaxID=2771008 RepID=A0A8J6Z7A4_9RHOB|nr:LysR family transcriptional regulator [Mangrovicoccus algicola]MBE3639264.1 LysR family transcriptional regulator [Mangrovicoccus algicola]